MGAKDSPKKAPDAPKGGQKRARSTEEKPEKAQKLTGARRIAVDLEWTAQQYAKYEVFRQEQKELKQARMWSPSKSQRAPAKLEFKQRLDTTGPAAESTVVDTLVSMGFSKEQAETAAKSTKGRSLEDAAAFLLGGAAARAPRRGR
jgi:Holliday junction resolvasome RuvABC DNA-binding subunit